MALDIFVIVTHYALTLFSSLICTILYITGKKIRKYLLAFYPLISHALRKLTSFPPHNLSSQFLSCLLYCCSICGTTFLPLTLYRHLIFAQISPQQGIFWLVFLIWPSMSTLSLWHLSISDIIFIHLSIVFHFH